MKLDLAGFFARHQDEGLANTNYATVLALVAAEVAEESCATWSVNPHNRKPNMLTDWRP